MDEENSNPETGELSDDDAIAAMRAAREPQASLEGDDVAEAAEEPEAEAEPEPEAEPVKFIVKVDGEEIEVTQDELLSGYQRDADYRRKTQALAVERKEIDAEKARQKELTASLIRENQKLVGSDEPEPDWIKLSEDDPIGYVQKRAQWDAKQARKEQARKLTEELVNQQRAEIAQAEAARLREKAPEWNDPQTFTRDYQALVSDAAKFYGFNANELAEVLDHRTLLALRDAAAYRNLKAKTAIEKKVAEAPKPVAKPGSPVRKAELTAKDMDALRQKFSRAHGQDQDAYAVELLRAARKR